MDIFNENNYFAVDYDETQPQGFPQNSVILNELVMKVPYQKIIQFHERGEFV